MKLVNKSLLAVVIAAVCTPAFASITDGERDAAMEQFNHGANLLDTLPSNTPLNQFDTARQEAIAGLQRLGVKADDMERVIENYQKLQTPAALSQWVQYDLTGPTDEEPVDETKTPTAPVTPGSKLDTVLKGVGVAASDVGIGSGQTTTDPVSNTTDTVNNKDVEAIKTGVSKNRTALVKAGHEMVSIEHTVANHAKSLQEQHQALVSVGTEINDVKHDVSNLESSSYNNHVALVKAGKEINTLREGNKVIAGKVEQNATDLQSVATYAKSTHDQTLVNKDGISKNAAEIAATSDVAAGTAKQMQIQNSDRVQGMLHARQVAETNAAVKAAVDATPAANKAAINDVKGDVKTLAKQQQVQSVYYGAQIQSLANDATVALNEQADAINTNTRQLGATRAQVTDNTQSINKLNSNFSSLKNQVNDNKKQASAGVSGAMAQANIPQVLNGQTFAVGAGVGGYDGENAVAVGMSMRATQNVVVKATVSDDTQQNLGYGAGVSVGW